MINAATPITTQRLAATPFEPGSEPVSIYDSKANGVLKTPTQDGQPRDLDEGLQPPASFEAVTLPSAH
jgi:hypothetical protein